MRRYRRGARFVDPRQHCRPLSRDERAKILFLAENLERRTRPAGRRNGVLGEIGLRTLRALVRFVRKQDGYCAPSYLQLAAASGLCKASIAAGLRRLERAGILHICRRLVREIVDGVLTVRQASNLYSVSEPAAGADQLPTPSPAPRPFPRPAYSALAKMLGWGPSLPARRKSTLGFQ